MIKRLSFCTHLQYNFFARSTKSCLPFQGGGGKSLHQYSMLLSKRVKEVIIYKIPSQKWKQKSFIYAFFFSGAQSQSFFHVISFQKKGRKTFISLLLYHINQGVAVLSKCPYRTAPYFSPSERRTNRTVPYRTKELHFFLLIPEQKIDIFK